jgi:hypothetical protein
MFGYALLSILDFWILDSVEIPTVHGVYTPAVATLGLLVPAYVQYVHM